MANTDNFAKELVEKFRYEIDNHIHELVGFFIEDDEYDLQVSRTESDKTEYEVKGKFPEYIKNQILFEFIYGPRLNHHEPKTKYTLQLIPKRGVKNSRKANQKGGALLPPTNPLPADCVIPLNLRFHHSIDPVKNLDRAVDVIGMYNEPYIQIIENIEKRIAHANYDSILNYLNTNRLGEIAEIFQHLRPPAAGADAAAIAAADAAVIAALAGCNPGELVEAQDNHNYYETGSRGWKKIMLVHHLCTNKYAHNGIGQEELDSVLLNALLSKSFKNVVRIHTLLHSYDNLFMSRFGTDNFWRTYIHIYGSLHRIRTNADPPVHDRDFIKCYEHLLTQHSGDFLTRNAANHYVTPYSIGGIDAMGRNPLLFKVRQYRSSLNEIKRTFTDQIIPEAIAEAVNATQAVSDAIATLVGLLTTPEVIALIATLPVRFRPATIQATAEASVVAAAAAAAEAPQNLQRVAERTRETITAAQAITLVINNFLIDEIGDDEDEALFEVMRAGRTAQRAVEFVQDAIQAQQNIPLPVGGLGETVLLPNVAPFANREIQLASKKLEKTIDLFFQFVPGVVGTLRNITRAKLFCEHISNTNNLVELPVDPVAAGAVAGFNVYINQYISAENIAEANAAADAIAAIIAPPVAVAPAVVPGANHRRRKTRRSSMKKRKSRKARRF